MKESIINVRVSKKLKEKASRVLKKKGMSMSSAITIFLHQLSNGEMSFWENSICNRCKERGS